MYSVSFVLHHIIQHCEPLFDNLSLLSSSLFSDSLSFMLQMLVPDHHLCLFEFYRFLLFKINHFNMYCYVLLCLSFFFIHENVSVFSLSICCCHDYYCCRWTTCRNTVYTLQAGLVFRRDYTTLRSIRAVITSSRWRYIVSLLSPFDEKTCLHTARGFHSINNSDI